jgi:hypothetical protein
VRIPPGLVEDQLPDRRDDDIPPGIGDKAFFDGRDDPRDGVDLLQGFLDLVEIENDRHKGLLSLASFGATLRRVSATGRSGLSIEYYPRFPW